MVTRILRKIALGAGVLVLGGVLAGSSQAAEPQVYYVFVAPRTYVNIMSPRVQSPRIQSAQIQSARPLVRPMSVRILTPRILSPVGTIRYGY
jgi:hypothetical protein